MLGANQSTPHITELRPLLIDRLIEAGAGRNPAAAVLPPDVGISEVLVPERQFGAAGKFMKFDGYDRLRQMT